MFAHKFAVVVLVMMSFEAPIRAEEQNFCFDGKKFNEEMSSYQDACVKELKVTNESKHEAVVLACTYKKLGLLTKSGDKFDFVKVKEFYSSRIKDHALKAKLVQGLTACESKDPAVANLSKDGYYDCLAHCYRKTCTEKQ